jgi:hypothetical protein
MKSPSKWSFTGGRTMLPRRLPQPKLGVNAPPRKVWPRHRRWVRSHGCCVPDCPASRVDFAHLRSAANAGKGLKPHDAFGISLCRAHHIEQHTLGAASFGQKHGIDLWALAREFARRTPDQRMRFSLTGHDEPTNKPEPAAAPEAGNIKRGPDHFAAG